MSVDGPSGSGKSTFAAALGRLADDRGLTVHVLHADDLLDGWDGLPGLGPRLRNYVVGPLASGHPARYRRYDWDEGRFAEEHVIAPMDLLVIEGCGSGHPNLASRRATLVWFEVDTAIGLERAVARDGQAIREHLVAWREAERRLYAGYPQPIRRWADFCFDTSAHP